MPARLTYQQFLTTYFAQSYDLAPCAPFHQAAVDAASEPGYRGIWQWFRAAGKSLHAGLFLPLYMLTQHSGPGAAFRFMLLVGRTHHDATRLLADLHRELKHNTQLCNDFDIHPIKDHFRRGDFAVRVRGVPVAFMALGAGQSPRGIRQYGRRPDFILADDLDHAPLSRSPRRLQQQREWLMQELLPAMDLNRTNNTSGRFLMIGNRFSEQSLIHELAESGHFDVHRVNAFDDLGRLTWPQKYPDHKWFNQQRIELGELAFAREYMNQSVPLAQVFKPEWIRWQPALPLHEYHDLICYIDPSFSNHPESDFKAAKLWGRLYDSPQSGVSPAGGGQGEVFPPHSVSETGRFDSLFQREPPFPCHPELVEGRQGHPTIATLLLAQGVTGTPAMSPRLPAEGPAERLSQASYHCLRAFLRQSTTADLIHWCYDLYEQIPNNVAIRFFIEGNGAQQFLLHAFDEIGRARGTVLPIRADLRAKPNKAARIQAMAHLWERGHIAYDAAQRTCPDMQRSIAQLLAFAPTGSTFHDDGPDADEGALHYLIKHPPPRHQPIIISRKQIRSHSHHRF